MESTGTGFGAEQWRSIFDLAQAAAELPEDERPLFLASTGSSSEIINEALVLAKEFNAPDIEIVSQQPLWLGQTVSHFLVTGYLGRGGVGEVYVAQDNDLQRSVALKFLVPEIIGLQSSSERFLREARLVSALNHPNIVTTYEVVQIGSVVAIAMELVEGQVLRELCRSPLPVPQTLDIGLQIARALEVAHSLGIIHRDIKPENVIVRPDGCVKVLDFGLARKIATEQRPASWTSLPGVPVGTWCYMSPEQFRGELLTGASDIFSLGLVLYEVCTGLQPFRNGPVVVPPPSKSNPSIPRSLDRLIGAMLDPDPAARPSAAAVVRALDHRPPRKRVKRSAWLAIAVMLALLGAWFW